MSFLSVLKGIGHGVQVATVAVAPFAPILSAIPGFGGAFGLVFNTLVHVEVFTAGDGPAKKAEAMAILQKAMPGANPALLSNVVDGLVGILNGLAQAHNDQLAAGTVTGSIATSTIFTSSTTK